MNFTDSDSEKWLRRYHPSATSGARLICFPHAGGSASYYHPVSAYFPPDVDVIALQYPGRQDRRMEPCITDLGVLADRITAQITGLSEMPTVLFGHSMGAILAFEVAWRLERDFPGRGARVPLSVIASGRRAPGIVRPETIHQRDDAGLLDEIRMLNGTRSTILDDEEILRIALPALRGDYRAIETYPGAEGRVLDAPLTVLVGDSDPRTKVEDALAWKAHTSGAFRMEVFSGGHFFLADHARAVNAEIAKEVALIGSRVTP